MNNKSSSLLNEGEEEWYGLRKSMYRLQNTYTSLLCATVVGLVTVAILFLKDYSTASIVFIVITLLSFIGAIIAHKRSKVLGILSENHPSKVE